MSQSLCEPAALARARKGFVLIKDNYWVLVKEHWWCKNWTSSRIYRITISVPGLGKIQTFLIFLGMCKNCKAVISPFNVIDICVVQIIRPGHDMPFQYKNSMANIDSLFSLDRK